MVQTAIHTSRKAPEIIIQVSGRAIEEAGNDPDEVVSRLREYDELDVLDRVLLDKSMGRGLGMNAEALRPFAQAIKKAFPSVGLVVAGGLGPDTLHLMEPLLGEFPNISIDAQGKLRPSGNSLDPIDWDLAERYLVNALKLLLK